MDCTWWNNDDQSIFRSLKESLCQMLIIISSHAICITMECFTG